jgi:serine/threonine protein kinase
MSLEGTLLGRYQLYQMLGRGGMGEVYLAEDSGIGRQVAIKVVRSEPYYNFDLESAERKERLFEREMKVISQLDHPYILPLYDYGETRVDGTTVAYMVMPYRPEGSFSAWLQERSKRGLLPLQDVANFIGQAASALQHAHEHQVIHQDVKPANFLMRVRPEEPDHPDLLLMDFGISRFSTMTTNTSQFIEGTPAYMAPEQWKGHPTYASDQYALAVMAYELLAGRQPFDGRAESIMYKHINEMPAEPSSINRVLSAEIDAVLLHALAKEPEERFASVAVFASSLQQACNEEQAAITSTRLTNSGSQSGQSMLANEQLERERNHIITRLKTNPNEAEYAMEQSSSALPVAMAPTPIFYEPPVMERSETGQQMVQPMAEVGGMGAPVIPYSVSMITPLRTPQRSATMTRTLRIGLVIILIWAAGGLFYYLAFARTAAPTSSSPYNTAVTATRAGNAVSTAQKDDSAGAHQTGTSTTKAQTTTQAQSPANVQTGNNTNVQATAQAQQQAKAQAMANAQATSIAQDNAKATAAANADATSIAQDNARATAAVVALAAPLYRLYNPKTGDHFYTMSIAERNNAVAADGYTYEGIASYVFSSQVANSAPLYRLVSTRTGDHFYTLSATERDNAVAADGYTYEGIAGYVFSTQVPKSVPLYRLYNSKTGDHFYTTSASERDNAVAVDGYIYERIACYVLTS